MRTTKTIRPIAAGLALGVLLAAIPMTAQAQGIDNALNLYKKREFPDAAFSFYDIMAHDSSADTRDQAKIYLAETLRKMHLLVPAMFYYKDILLAGRQNRYYLNAIEGLLKVQQELHDPLFVPSLINNNLDPQGFGRLSPDEIARVNYMIGELSFRQGKNQDAKAFLAYVPPESPMYPKAEYLQALLDVRAKNSKGALGVFQTIMKQVHATSSDADKLHVRNLAIIGAARAAYGLGHFKEAVKYFKEVPRFSDEWFTAMYEDAWAFFQLGEYGKTLGELSSVTSPYFNKREVPEAYVIQGTTYFTNCQWDRVRRAVKRYKGTYQPMLNTLTAYLKVKRAPAEYYRDVVAGGAGQFALEIARAVRRSHRFHEYHFMLEHMKWEAGQAAAEKVWKGSQMAQDFGAIIGQLHDQLADVVGSWVRRRLQKQQQMLKHFQNQIDILDFEVADAERKWLEEGKEILKGRRPRLPRPDIPNDQWQHWKFEREYWKDELGYIQHSLACECLTHEECEAVTGKTPE